VVGERNFAKAGGEPDGDPDRGGSREAVGHDGCGGLHHAAVGQKTNSIEEARIGELDGANCFEDRGENEPERGGAEEQNSRATGRGVDLRALGGSQVIRLIG
jgi:hypothetical protein